MAPPRRHFLRRVSLIWNCAAILARWAVPAALWVAHCLLGLSDLSRSPQLQHIINLRLTHNCAVIISSAPSLLRVRNFPVEQKRCGKKKLCVCIYLKFPLSFSLWNYGMRCSSLKVEAKNGITLDSMSQGLPTLSQHRCRWKVGR